jgi:hypothetical protein
VVSGTPFTPDEQARSTEDAAVVLRPSGTERLRATLKKFTLQGLHWLLSSHNKVDWNTILACPKCHGDIAVQANVIHCLHCHLDYPVEDGVPIMLIDHARPAGTP